MKRLTRLIPYAVAMLSALLCGCVTEPSLLTGEDKRYGYSWEQELQLGKQTDPEIVAQMGLYQDDELADYVRDIGQTLLSHSAMRAPDAPELYRGTEFTFRLLDSPVVNAFALPGGYVYVTRGLLAHLGNEAQLAVVIGHEITHVEARHASKQALKQQWGQIGLIAGAIIGEQVAENKEFAREMVNLGGSLFQLVTLKYGRDAERESDYYGVEYASKSGYDASEGSEFFRSLERLSEKSGQSIPSWQSSHPDPGEREEKIRELAAEWQKDIEANEIGRERYLAKIEGMVVGENPRNGYFEDGQFLHPDLEFKFDAPQGWKTQNEPAAVYLAAPDGQAVLAFSGAKEDSPIAAAQALIKRVQMQTTYAQEDSVNGKAAYLVEGVVANQSGSLSVYSLFVEHQGSVFNFLGYGKAESFAAYKGRIRSVSQSFQTLTDSRALSIQPYRLAIVPAERNAPFRDLLPAEFPPGTDESDWAIMNQVELDEPIERGRLIKLPGQR